jgi:hypothetical protein
MSRPDPLGLDLAEMAHNLGWTAAKAKILQHLLDRNVDPTVIREIVAMDVEPCPAIELTRATWERAGVKTQ